jgi:hypothetical protein
MPSIFMSGGMLPMNCANEKGRLWTDLNLKSGPVKDLQTWVNYMLSKIPRVPVLKMIKIRPEVFENLITEIPIETCSSGMDDQASNYFSVPIQIVPNLKTSIEYIYN